MSWTGRSCWNEATEIFVFISETRTRFSIRRNRSWQRLHVNTELQSGELTFVALIVSLNVVILLSISRVLLLSIKNRIMNCNVYNYFSLSFTRWRLTTTTTFLPNASEWLASVTRWRFYRLSHRWRHCPAPSRLPARPGWVRTLVENRLWPRTWAQPRLWETFYLQTREFKL